MELKIISVTEISSPTPTNFQRISGKRFSQINRTQSSMYDGGVVAPSSECFSIERQSVNFATKSTLVINTSSNPSRPIYK